MSETTTKVNSNVKDTVFRLLFKEKAPLLELYNAMNDSDYDNPDDLIITTLEASIFVGMKNDLSYIFNDQLFLYEHQSTVNPNMPLRDFLYLSSLYSKLVKDEHIYSTRLIKIPEPKFIVFYNGTQEMPEYCQMKLSDAFEKTSENPDLELTVHHYNINIGYNKRLMERSKTLHEYMLFVGKMREYVSVFGKDEGVKYAVDDCIKNGILSSFLLEKKAEVIMIGVYEYDEEKHMRIVARDARAEGFEDALSQAKVILVESLSRIGDIPDSIKKKVEQLNKLDVLMAWNVIASTSDTMEEFEKKLKHFK